MRYGRVFAAAPILAFVLTLGCNTQTKSPDVSGQVRQGLDQAGLSDVHVSQDRDKGVITLTGNVASDQDKSKAESVAKANAAGQVIANEIGVRPKDDSGDARKVDSDLDSGIDKNLDAMLVQHKLNHAVRYDVKNGVVTLKGDLPSSGQRDSVQQLAQNVPNVKQVVNEIEVKNQKATSSK